MTPFLPDEMVRVTEGENYTARTGTVTFPIGETSIMWRVRSVSAVIASSAGGGSRRIRRFPTRGAGQLGLRDPAR